VIAAYLRSGAGGVSADGAGFTEGVTGGIVGSTLAGSVVDPAGTVLPTTFDDSFI
jgi:hypothetical protein